MTRPSGERCSSTGSVSESHTLSVASKTGLSLFEAVSSGPEQAERGWVHANDVAHELAHLARGLGECRAGAGTSTA